MKQNVKLTTVLYIIKFMIVNFVSYLKSANSFSFSRNTDGGSLEKQVLRLKLPFYETLIDRTKRQTSKVVDNSIPRFNEFLSDLKLDNLFSLYSEQESRKYLHHRKGAAFLKTGQK